MNDQKQGPSFIQVRAAQLREKAESPYHISFLYFLRERVQSLLYARLRKKDLPLFELLVMLYILCGRVELGQVTGLDVEEIGDVVAKATRAIDWEVE